MASRLRRVRTRPPRVVVVWCHGSRLAVDVNFECGGEANILDGDPESEGLFNGIGFPPVVGKRDPLAKSVSEFGSRVGI